MGMRRGPATTGAALAAVVIGACALTAACGNGQPGRSGGGAGGGPSGGHAAGCTATPRAAAGQLVTVSNRDNGKVLCVSKGTTVAVYLQGTPARRWGPIHTSSPSSPALTPVASGRLMLKVGETGAFFKAVRPGVARVTSSLPSCKGGAPAAATAEPGGTPCKMGMVFHLTLVVQ